MKMVLTFCGLLLLGFLKPGAKMTLEYRDFLQTEHTGWWSTFGSITMQFSRTHKLKKNSPLDDLQMQFKLKGREDPRGEIVPRHENPEKSVLLPLCF